MNNKGSNLDKKMFYVFVTCIVLSLVIVGATFAFFTASASDDESVSGVTSAASLSLSVTKITSLDLTFGLVPMKNDQAPYAAEQLCYDDYNNIGCQIYKITLRTDSDTPMFVDGYITTDVIDGIETRFTRVYPKEVSFTDPNTNITTVDNIFSTSYTKEDMLLPSFDIDANIKSGELSSVDLVHLNRTDDYDALFVSDEQIGGDNSEVDFYLMIWIWDDGTNQDFIQGAQIVYTGLATFITAQGNEIKASFD